MTNPETLSDGLVKLEQIVRPLPEWRRGYCDERVTIHQSSNGWLYQVRILDGIVWLDLPDRTPPTQFLTLEEAKASAEADYRARIASALNLDPILSEIKRMREALTKVRSYNVDIDEGRINYRPADHIAVIDRALSTLSPQEPDNADHS